MHGIRGYLFYIHTENFLALCSYLFIYYLALAIVLTVLFARLHFAFPDIDIVRHLSKAILSSILPNASR